MCVFPVLSAPLLQPSDVFEQPHPTGPKKIEFHISVPEVAAVVEENRPGQPDDESRDNGPGNHLELHTVYSDFLLPTLFISVHDYVYCLCSI